MNTLLQLAKLVRQASILAHRNATPRIQKLRRKLRPIMKEEIREVLGVGERSFKVPMLVYESMDEADKAAGKQGAALKEMNNNLLYRGTYSDARSLIVDVVQRLSKVPVKMRPTGEKDKDGKPIMERDPADSDKKYVERAFADGKLDFDKVEAEVQKIARAGVKKADGTWEWEPLAADISQRERKPAGPKKLADRWKNIATEFLTGKKNLKALNKRLEEFNIGAFTPTGDATKDAEALGWKCKAYQDAQDAFKNM